MEVSTNVDLRRVLYRFHAALLLYPDPTRVHKLQEGAEWLQQRLEHGGIPEAIADVEVLAALVGWASQLEINPAATQAEWTRLFGTSRVGYCYPFEGAHGPPEMSSALMVALQREYAETGLKLSGQDLPDFVATEFEYLSHLCYLTGYAAGEQNRAAVEKLSRRRHRFLANHLCRWVPQLIDRVVENDGGVYALALQSGLNFAELDHRELEQALQISSSPATAN